MAAEFITSDNLPHARMLPLNVIPPITIDNKIVMSVNVVVSPEYKAAQPTNKLAMPPDPLNKATISGIDVISIFWATTAPMIAPTNAAIAIH